LIPFLVLLAGVGQTVIFAEVGGISKALLNWLRGDRSTNLDLVGCVWASVVDPRRWRLLFSTGYIPKKHVFLPDLWKQRCCFRDTLV